MMPSPVGHCHRCGETIFKNCTGEVGAHHCPPERIVAAAIQEGKVTFTGAHHATIIHYIAKCTGKVPVTGQQGFMTNFGNFVSRKHALILAVAARQVDPDQCSETGLMSENLWLVPDIDLQVQDALQYLDGGRLFDLEGTEIPTSIAERAKWVACALAAETDGHREARNNIRLLKEIIREQIATLTRLIGDENE